MNIQPRNVVRYKVVAILIFSILASGVTYYFLQKNDNEVGTTKNTVSVKSENDSASESSAGKRSKPTTTNAANKLAPEPAVEDVAVRDSNITPTNPSESVSQPINKLDERKRIKKMDTQSKILGRL